MNSHEVLSRIPCLSLHEATVIASVKTYYQAFTGLGEGKELALEFAKIAAIVGVLSKQQTVNTTGLMQ